MCNGNCRAEPRPSIFAEEAPARSFIAREIWPGADDIKATGPICSKARERDFPHCGRSETRVVQEGYSPAGKAMDHAVMAVVFLGVCVCRGGPVIGRKEQVNKHPSVAQRQRQSASERRIVRCRSIPDQHQTGAVRVTYPRIRRIKRSEGPQCTRTILVPMCGGARPRC